MIETGDDIHMADIKLHPYAAAVIVHLKDQLVEIYSGDVKTTTKFAEQDVEHKNVIRGKLIAAVGDSLIVLVEKNGRNAKVFVNAWGVRAIVALEEKLYIKDIYEDEYEGFAEKFKYLLNRNK
jgi:hypothetical protein